MSTKTKYTYSVESYFMDKWVKLFTDSRDFCAGYLHRASDYHPRNAMRMIRSDGKIIVELKKDDEAATGMIASWPTPEQYELAAQQALERAAIMRQKAEKKTNYQKTHALTINVDELYPLKESPNYERRLLVLIKYGGTSSFWEMDDHSDNYKINDVIRNLIEKAKEKQKT